MILCLCQRGNVRSATLASILKDLYDKDAIAAGLEANSVETLHLLMANADKIFLVLPYYYLDAVPDEYVEKTTVLNIGDDRWGMPMHPNLVSLLLRILDGIYTNNEIRNYGSSDEYLQAVKDVFERIL